LFDERNLVAHLDEFEGDPRRRPLTVDELDAFFAACEARIATTRARGRKGSLQAWRGGPQRRTVLTVFDWATEVLEQYVTEIRPRFGCPEHPAMFLTERGTRIAPTVINERFAEIRTEAELDAMLTPHRLRHSYVTHLAELGWAAKFIQDQVGHSHAATTAIYMSVGDDFEDRMVRSAIDAQLAQLNQEA
jgi:integrase/recombinase XerC